jgi:iron complex transport system substrate-binding protein
MPSLAPSHGVNVRPLNRSRRASTGRRKTLPVVCSAVSALIAVVSSSVPFGDAFVAQSAFPVSIDNCGTTSSYARAPARAVTLNQAATEVMLALGLEDRLVGTAYLDDEVLPQFADAYRRIPVLASKYPAREVLLAARPDFIYAAYTSAFAPTAVGARSDWSKRNVNTYLAPAACADKTRPPGVTLETSFTELLDVARIFGVTTRAELITGYRAELRAVRDRIGPAAKPLKVFWYDSGDPPEAEVCCGTPNEILRLLGAENIFVDTRGSWAPVSWEAVIARNPDVIVLANASWSTAATKQTLLLSNQAFAGIEAVKRQRFVEIDFAYTTPGIRNVAAIRSLAAALYPDRFR